jgi:hypothetical protein
VRLARHRVNGDRLCCHCYVRRGYPPATWHPECVAAAAARRKNERTDERIRLENNRQEVRAATASQ